MSHIYNNLIVGKQIYKRRKQLKLSQEALAEKIINDIYPEKSKDGTGITYLKNKISAIERGCTSTKNLKRIDLYFEEVVAICNALDCDISYLLGETNYNGVEYSKQKYKIISKDTGLDEYAIKALCQIQKDDQKTHRLSWSLILSMFISYITYDKNNPFFNAMEQYINAEQISRNLNFALDEDRYTYVSPYTGRKIDKSLIQSDALSLVFKGISTVLDKITITR